MQSTSSNCSENTPPPRGEGFYNTVELAKPCTNRENGAKSSNLIHILVALAVVYNLLAILAVSCSTIDGVGGSMNCILPQQFWNGSIDVFKLQMYLFSPFRQSIEPIWRVKLFCGIVEPVECEHWMRILSVLWRTNESDLALYLYLMDLVVWLFSWIKYRIWNGKKCSRISRLSEVKSNLDWINQKILAFVVVELLTNPRASMFPFKKSIIYEPPRFVFFDRINISLQSKRRAKKPILLHNVINLHISR